MEIFSKLSKKKKKLIIGLMSGTSADGIDAALIEVSGSGIRTRFRQLAFQTYCYPPGFKNFLLKNSDAATARLDDISRLDILIAFLFAETVQKLLIKTGRRAGEIDFIGSHGQTVQHLPVTRKMFGINIHSTFQIGNPSVIAKLTGIVTIGNFRAADVGVGGSGAPLVPFIDYLIMRSRTKNRAVLNIGGISNITVIPKNSGLNKLFAFDTGPGNIVIDRLMKIFYKKEFDKNGEVALKGKIIPSLLSRLAQHPYLRLRPPKSTGREMFGEAYIEKILDYSRGKKREDIVATVSEFTPLSIYLSYLWHIKEKIQLDELIVSGGGTDNLYILDGLKKYFGSVMVMKSEEFNLSSAAKEAVCFALLANEAVSGNPGNVPGATGAEKQTILGMFCLP